MCRSRADDATPAIHLRQLESFERVQSPRHREGEAFPVMCVRLGSHQCSTRVVGRNISTLDNALVPRHRHHWHHWHPEQPDFIHCIPSCSSRLQNPVTQRCQSSAECRQCNQPSTSRPFKPNWRTVSCPLPGASTSKTYKHC